MKKRGNRNGIFLKNNKRGLSTIVVTLIIILLSLVAVGVMWVVVKNLITTGSKQVGLGKFTIDLSIKNSLVQNDNISVDVRRNAGQGDLLKIKFLLSDGQNSEVITQDSNQKELEVRTFSLHPNQLNASQVIKISIVPVFMADDGSETFGDVTDTYNLRTGQNENNGNGNNGGNPGNGAVCGNGAVETGESCDLTNFGNLTCADFGFTGGGSLACSSCQISTIQCIGGSVGTCGDGNIDAGEECDGTHFGGLTCASFGFTGGGDLNCVLCNISTFGCVNQGQCVPDCTNRVCGLDPICNQSCGSCSSPNTCTNGICVPPTCVDESTAETCGTWICGNKVNNCGHTVNCGLCSGGTLCDGQGGCSSPTSLNSGSVEETWPGTSGLYFGSVDLPTNVSYQGKYIKFPSKSEIGCIIISQYSYPVSGYDKSFVKLSEATSIETGDSYEIFQSLEECSPPG